MEFIGHLYIEYTMPYFVPNAICKCNAMLSLLTLLRTLILFASALCCFDSFSRLKIQSNQFESAYKEIESFSCV